MTTDQIVDVAIEEGFSRASVIDTSRIVFDASFRSYCEENLCGQYGANHSCPPVCGSPEEMRQRILKHTRALVLQTVWDVTGWLDDSLVNHAKESHKTYTFNVIERLERQGFHGFMVGASFCSLCTPCAIKDFKPCKFPQEQYSCMSAYYIYVKDLAEKCGMDYDYKEGALQLFSLYMFD